MKQRMKRLVAGVLTGSFFLVALLLLFAAGMERTILDPVGRESLVDQLDLPDRIHQEALDYLPEYLADGVLGFSPDGWIRLLPESWGLGLREKVQELTAPVVRAAAAAFDPQWIRGELLEMGDDWAMVVRGQKYQPESAIRLEQRKDLFHYLLLRELTGLSPSTLAILGITEERPGKLLERFPVVEAIPDRLEGQVIWTAAGGSGTLAAGLSRMAFLRKAIWYGGGFFLLLSGGLLWWITGIGTALRRIGTALILAGLAGAGIIFVAPLWIQREAIRLMHTVFWTRLLTGMLIGILLGVGLLLWGVVHRTRALKREKGNIERN